MVYKEVIGSDTTGESISISYKILTVVASDVPVVVAVLRTNRDHESFGCAAYPWGEVVGVVNEVKHFMRTQVIQCELLARI